MASAEIETVVVEKVVEEKQTQVTLVLSEEEAGYLRNLLYRHIGGMLAISNEPLGSILEALTEAKVGEKFAWRVTRNTSYSILYPSLETVPESDRYLAHQRL